MLALVVLSSAGAGSAQRIRATVDDATVQFPDVQPVMINGRVMVPVRGVFEHMSAVVVWDEASRTVTAQHGTDTIRLPIDSRNATINEREVALDSPATLYAGRTIVPLRFLSESLGASVEWVAATRTVQINTNGAAETLPVIAGINLTHMDAGTVIPFTLNQRLSSDEAEQGDKFTANLDTGNSSSYLGLPSGTVVEGHVDVARPKEGDTPGVLGLAFDRIRTPDGKTYPVRGALIGLDDKSIDKKGGRYVARGDAKKDNLKYVGYGAGGGALLAIITRGNVLTTALIGGALGYLFGEIHKDPSRAHEVTLDSGTRFGLRLTQDLPVRAAGVRR
jgi:hypothetical protein